MKNVFPKLLLIVIALVQACGTKGENIKICSETIQEQTEKTRILKLYFDPVGVDVIDSEYLFEINNYPNEKDSILYDSTFIVAIKIKGDSINGLVPSLKQLPVTLNLTPWMMLDLDSTKWELHHQPIYYVGKNKIACWIPKTNIFLYLQKSHPIANKLNSNRNLEYINSTTLFQFESDTADYLDEYTKKVSIQNNSSLQINRIFNQNAVQEDNTKTSVTPWGARPVSLPQCFLSRSKLYQIKNNLLYQIEKPDHIISNDKPMHQQCTIGEFGITHNENICADTEYSTVCITDKVGDSLIISNLGNTILLPSVTTDTVYIVSTFDCRGKISIYCVTE